MSVSPRSPATEPRQVLVLGGAGFIGHHICARLHAAGWSVTAVDGLMAGTESALLGFDRLPADIFRIQRRIREAADLTDVIADNDVVVDAMGWTSHWGGNREPLHDIELNLIPHIALAQAFAVKAPSLTIYLGSRHQYGRLDIDGFDETAPLNPMDVQGIHKVAAERHLALAAVQHKTRVVSLRFGNTFGPGMPVQVDDIGLVGDFLRRAVLNDVITVFGSGRRRTLHFAPDVADTVAQLTGSRLPEGFTALNVPGKTIAVHELAEMICRAAGGGTVEERPLNLAVEAIDVGDRELSTELLASLCGETTLMSLDAAFALTVADVRGRLMAMQHLNDGVHR